ncbi:MAG: hypothetical protein ACLPID_08520 [Beijerinckiaceae bacterium]
MRPSLLIAVALVVVAMSGSSKAADLQVQEIKAYLFFSNSGKLSENIVGSKKEFWNTGAGDGEAGGAAKNVLVDLVLAGEDPTPQGEIASLKVTYQAPGPRDVVIKKTYKSFFFGQNGVIHESVFLEDATCATVQIEAHAGKSSKTATLKFHCGE